LKLCVNWGWLPLARSAYTGKEERFTKQKIGYYSYIPIGDKYANYSRHRIIPIGFEMVDMAFDVMIETGILVEALPIWLEERGRPSGYLNPLLLAKIDKDGGRV